jgi:Response regulators consisting of a CheY-like receiver domain and a winged-helix DNA-binding domain
MQKILIADDEERFRRIVVMFLKKEGYEVVEASDGNEALNILTNQPDISLAILDIMMPYINGLELCKIIKEQLSIPVLILTAKNEDEDQISSFNSGADDYISKPVNFSILILRVKALLRRVLEDINVINYSDLVIDLNSHIVKIKNEEIPLTRKEFEILVYLIENRNKVLSREDIKEKIWDKNKESDIRLVDTHVKNLRTKLGEYGDIIKTIRGYGYKIE